jgi:GT2 family glycosyltransferase
VVVVSRNRAVEFRRCLESIEACDGRADYQVIAVDNGSTDGSALLIDDFPNVQFIRLPKNFGLTKALNLGWRAADAEYVLFLHDDTLIQPSVVRILADTLDSRADAAAVCPLLVDSQGQPAPQLGSLPPDGMWRPAQPGPACDVEYARGAAIMYRVYFIKALRQIDERYGQFGADADLAAEIRRANRKIVLVPSAVVQHEARGEYSAVEKADFLNARAVFLGKHQGMGAGLQARLGAVLGPLAGFRFGELKHTIGAQKIDGTQE